MPKYFLPVFVALFIYACNDRIETTKPTIGTMTESVYASVAIQPADLYQVFAANSGILQQVFIEEGDTVAEGQILAKITSTNAAINVENAQLGVDFADESYRGQATILKRILDEIRSAETQLKLDSLNYFRQKRLWEQNIGAGAELDNQKLKYELTANNLDALKKKYQQTRLELENNFQQSKNTLKKAQTNLTDNFIKAKMSGTVYALLKNAGELISPQEPLAQIGQTNTFVIEMLIDEVDIVRIRLGQLALIALDAYEGQVFKATITKIYPLKDNRTQTFKIEGTFQEPPGVLYAGLSGEANIVISERKQIMTIPLEYLIEGNRVKTADGEIAVETGLKNIERVEILSGIDTGTVILKPGAL